VYLVFVVSTRFYQKEFVMNLPVQVNPVQRSVAGRPTMGRAGESSGQWQSAHGDHGLMPSEHGVEPSFDWTSLIPVATGLAGALGI
jgi:hypothetical protein